MNSPRQAQQQQQQHYNQQHQHAPLVMAAPYKHSVYDNRFSPLNASHQQSRPQHQQQTQQELRSFRSDDGGGHHDREHQHQRHQHDLALASAPQRHASSSAAVRQASADDAAAAGAPLPSAASPVIVPLPVVRSRASQQAATSAAPAPAPAAATKVVNKCANCGTDSTPLWRRGPKGEIICNACGLYLKARNTYRPQYLKKRRVRRECDAADLMAVSPMESGASHTASTPPTASAPAGSHAHHASLPPANSRSNSAQPQASESFRFQLPPLGFSGAWPHQAHTPAAFEERSTQGPRDYGFTSSSSTAHRESCSGQPRGHDMYVEHSPALEAHGGDAIVSHGAGTDSPTTSLGRMPAPTREHMQCINCSTTSTPLWRRDDKGNAICNACGLYFKLHNSHRPYTMKRAVIKRRKRVPPSINSTYEDMPWRDQPQQSQQLDGSQGQAEDSSSSPGTPSAYDASYDTSMYRLPPPTSGISDHSQLSLPSIKSLFAMRPYDGDQASPSLSSDEGPELGRRSVSSRPATPSVVAPAPPRKILPTPVPSPALQQQQQRQSVPSSSNEAAPRRYQSRAELVSEIDRLKLLLQRQEEVERMSGGNGPDDRRRSPDVEPLQPPSSPVYYSRSAPPPPLPSASSLNRLEDAEESATLALMSLAAGGR
ncbi:putative electron transfer flavoprotein subunit [Thoreauomyces humboldtii]|nr:putative electron transfer flavoprotein subunit [Thoreauomyces humboldtii]